jgi:RNA polymerase sigma-70 factor (ECF subfamily)
MKVVAEAITLEMLDDLALAKRAAARDLAAIRLITERNNQRLFRAAWSVLKDRAEAEDVVQEAYAKALAAIGGFAGEASLSTWLTRIVMNTAIDRKRSLARRAKFLKENQVAELTTYRDQMMAGSAAPSPEAATLRRELKSLLEQAVARLPEAYRCVFVLRDIEGMSIADVAAALEIPEATVKTRQWRAKRRLRVALEPDFRGALGESVDFAGADCARLTERVLEQLRLGAA